MSSDSMFPASIRGQSVEMRLQLFAMIGLKRRIAVFPSVLPLLSGFNDPSYTQLFICDHLIFYWSHILPANKRCNFVIHLSWLGSQIMIDYRAICSVVLGKFKSSENIEFRNRRQGMHMQMRHTDERRQMEANRNFGWIDVVTAFGEQLFQFGLHFKNYRVQRI